MCLIIRKPPGRPVSPDFLENAWQHNADGWGCVQRRGGRLLSAKGMRLDDLLAHSASLPVGGEAYLHLRKATHGHINPDMAHPYQVREGLLLMHNGRLDPLAPADSRCSDTWELARLLRDLLAGLSDAQVSALLRTEGFARLTAPLIHGSMVLLLDTQGAVRLGRDWHRVQPDEWDAPMQGVEVSNTHAWTPRAPRAAATVGRPLWGGAATCTA